MFNTLFGEGQYAFKMLWAFIAVFGFLALVLWVVRRSQRSNVTTHSRQPRLAVIDVASIDSRRQLILIRRDNAEHLLMIGGPTEVVIEPNIVRAAIVPRGTAAAQRPPLAYDALPHAVPLDEGSMWPSQFEPTPGSEPPPMDEETAQWPAPEPQHPPPPLPRTARLRDDLISGLAEEIGRVAPSPHFEPPRRQDLAKQRLEAVLRRPIRS